MYVAAGKIAKVIRFGPAMVAGESFADELSIDIGKKGVVVLDYGDLVISPGLIDTHVHMNEPGRVEWEGNCNPYTCPSTLTLTQDGSATGNCWPHHKIL